MVGTRCKDDGGRCSYGVHHDLKVGRGDCFLSYGLPLNP